MSCMKSYYVFWLMLLCTLGLNAQTRSTRLTIQVSSIEGDNLAGQPVTLMQTDYQVSYGALSLNASGQCAVNVYPGPHHLSLEREGFVPVSYDFVVAETETEKTISVTMTEKTRTPFALKATVAHNVYDGSNSIGLTWNQEEPAFFDDFESYAPFAVNFGQWTGIDADMEAAAPLIGNYAVCPDYQPVGRRAYLVVRLSYSAPL